MKTLNLLLINTKSGILNLKNSFQDYIEYKKAIKIVRKYDSHLPPYDSSEYKNGLIPQEVVEAKLILSLRKNS